jgi:hypothetical protein
MFSRFFVIALAGLCSIVTSRASNTVLVIDSPTGDPVGGGKHYYFTRADGTFSAQQNNPYSVTVFFDNPMNHWDLSFSSADQTPLAPGSYQNATRYPFNNGSGLPGIDISGNGTGCNTETGNFVIHEIVYGSGSTIIAFHASFDQSCEGAYPSVKGEIFFNATATPPPKNHITSDLTAFATRGQPFKYQIAGSSKEISYSASALPVGLKFNTTTGLISGTPAAEGSFAVRIGVADNAQKTVASLQLTVDPPSHSTGLYSALSLVADPGEYITAGQSQVFTAMDEYFAAGSNNDGNSATVVMHNTDYSIFWRLNFVAPRGQTLAVGPYAVTDPTNIDGPHLEVSGTQRGCDGCAGNFQIKEIEVIPNVLVKHFHATFESDNPGSTAVLRGAVWFDAAEAITSSPLIQLQVNQPFTYQTVANNDPTGFAATNLPAGLAMGSSTGIISGTPGMVGRFQVALTATNGAQEASDFVTLDVLPAPTPTPTPPPTPVMNVTVSSAQVNEGDDVTFTVTSSAVSARDLDVRYLTALKGSGTTTADYTLTPLLGVFTIPAGQTSASLILHAVTDTIQEKNESVSIKLTQPATGAGYTLGKQKKATVLIINVP